MTSRVTRSAARLAADSAAATSLAAAPTIHPPDPGPSQYNTRKRKARPAETASENHPDSTKQSPPRRSKRQKTTVPEPVSLSTPTSSNRRRSTKTSPHMAKPGSVHIHKVCESKAEVSRSSTNPEVEGDSAHPTGPESSRRKSGRNKKPANGKTPPHKRGKELNRTAETEASVTPAASSSRRPKKPSGKKNEEGVGKNREETPKGTTMPSSHRPSSGERSDDDDRPSPRRPFHHDDDVDDPFRSGFLSHAGHPSGLSSTLRALSGMVTGSSSKLREILPNLKEKDDPSVQLIALQELSELLLVSTEDNLSGQFSPDQFVKELVTLMQPNEFGEDNPEMMLLACRCIANLMEALPPSTANVVYGGAVPVLCQKLLEIHYIDVAEQALSVSFSCLAVCQPLLTALRADT